MPSGSHTGEFIGQENNIHRLNKFISSAQEKAETLDHILLEGPPGLGKTFMAGLVAKKLSTSQFVTAIGTSLQVEIDVTRLLLSITKNNAVLFIDEVHRMNKRTYEVLYEPMERYVLHMMHGAGDKTHHRQQTLPSFTLIAATTSGGNIPLPLRDRFRIKMMFDYYSPAELTAIICSFSKTIGLTLSAKGAMMIAEKSRGTPRVAKHIAKSVRDIAGSDPTLKGIKKALKLEKIGAYGIDRIDSAYLRALFTCKPRSVATIAKTIGVDADVLLNNHEPFLIRHSFIEITPKGRVILPSGLRVLEMVSSEGSVHHMTSHVLHPNT